MVQVLWRSLLPVILISTFILYEEWVSFPSCKLLPNATTTPANPDDNVGTEDDSLEDLKVMIVADLLLLGSEGGFFNLHFRDFYMSRFFQKSYKSLKPDLLLVLGDVSAKGSELSRSKWLSVLHQFDHMLGPFLDLPLHVILGDRDVGKCSGLDARFVHWISRNFPGLDSSGCGAFEISNISFVSLNSVALLCGDSRLRFGVEKVIERESTDLQMEIKGTDKAKNEPGMLREKSCDFGWRENAMTSGSGPVLLLHFPLYQSRTSHDPPGCKPAYVGCRGFSETGPYGLSQTVSPNVTEYIFHALKPRIIFSAHTQELIDHIHPDGTREVTVPAMTWKVKDDPGFIIATFGGNSSIVSVTYCSVAKESHIIIAYSSALLLFLLFVIISSRLRLKDLS